MNAARGTRRPHSTADEISDPIAEAERRGYLRAVAALRDDALYQEWNRRWGLDSAGPRSYVPAHHRDVIHDYIEWAVEP